MYMLLKRKYRLIRSDTYTFQKVFFMRVKKEGCGSVCKLYKTDKCKYYKPGCTWFLKKGKDYRYIPT